MTDHLLNHLMTCDLDFRGTWVQRDCAPDCKHTGAVDTAECELEVKADDTVYVAIVLQPISGTRMFCRVARFGNRHHRNRPHYHCPHDHCTGVCPELWVCHTDGDHPGAGMCVVEEGLLLRTDLLPFPRRPDLGSRKDISRIFSLTEIAFQFRLSELYVSASSSGVNRIYFCVL